MVGGFHGVLLQSAKHSRKTPCERRFGMPLNEPVIPFGAMGEYHPISAKDLSRLHQFGPKGLPRKIPLCAESKRNLEGRHLGRKH